MQTVFYSLKTFYENETLWLNCILFLHQLCTKKISLQRILAMFKWKAKSISFDSFLQLANDLKNLWGFFLVRRPHNKFTTSWSSIFTDVVSIYLLVRASVRTLWQLKNEKMRISAPVQCLPVRDRHTTLRVLGAGVTFHASAPARFTQTGLPCKTS